MRAPRSDVYAEFMRNRSFDTRLFMGPVDIFTPAVQHALQVFWKIERAGIPPFSIWHRGHAVEARPA